MNRRLWETAFGRAGELIAPLALDELPDAELLRRFLASREELAFTAIVRRHGPLVWGVCRNLLTAEADAEDAFQATFLALVRSASKLRQSNALGAWLHRVAGRVCKNSLRARSRRQKHERTAAVSEAIRPVDAATWDRWQAAVHAEIDRLPETLRVPFVLCVLQGVRQPEAARRLGWKLGTVSGRVCKAKQVLTEAISRRGLAAAAVLTAVVGGSTPLSAALVGRGKAVIASGSNPSHGISTTVHELARGAMGGLMSKTKILAATLLAGTLVIGVGTNRLSTAEAQPGPGGGLPGAGAGPGGVGALPGPGGPQVDPRFPPPGGGGGSGGGGFGGAPGMMGAGSTVRGPHVEYQFVARPKGTSAFKKLLNDRGNEMWEYVGMVPGEEELIFKRTQRPGGVMSGAMGGMGGVGAGMSMPGMGGMLPPLTGAGGFGQGPIGGIPSGPGGGPLGPGGSGIGGPPPLLPGGPGSGPPGLSGSGLGSGRPPAAGDPIGGDGVGTPTPGGAGPKPKDLVEILPNETIRHRMSNLSVVERVRVLDPKIAEVSLDPTDARRVVIKAVSAGGTTLELTDDKGATEKVRIRVR